jgi:hypothetical protein
VEGGASSWRVITTRRWPANVLRILTKCAVPELRELRIL